MNNQTNERYTTEQFRADWMNLWKEVFERPIEGTVYDMYCRAAPNLVKAFEESNEDHKPFSCAHFTKYPNAELEAERRG